MNTTSRIVLVWCLLLPLFVLSPVLSGGLTLGEYFQRVKDAFFEYVLW